MRFINWLRQLRHRFGTSEASADAEPEPLYTIFFVPHDERSFLHTLTPGTAADTEPLKLATLNVHGSSHAPVRRDPEAEDRVRDAREHAARLRLIPRFTITPIDEEEKT